MNEQEYWYTRYAEDQQYRETQHAAIMGNIQKQYGFYQLCPKCDGEDQIPNIGTSSSVWRMCPVCNGAKLLIRPEIQTPQPKEDA